MNVGIYRFLCLIVLSAAALVSQAVLADDEGCVVDPNGSEPPAGKYKAVWASGHQGCPQGHQLVLFKSYSEAPAPVDIACTVSPGNVTCEAWPQGPQINYGWSTTGGVQFEYTPQPGDSLVYATCTGNNGFVNVTTSSPGYATASTRAYIDCNDL